jgi:hypothetical protein
MAELQSCARVQNPAVALAGTDLLLLSNSFPPSAGFPHAASYAGTGENPSFTCHKWLGRVSG